MLRTRSGLPKHCSWNADRHGTRRVRFRRRGVSVYLTGIPWSEDFMRQYAVALEGVLIAPRIGIDVEHVAVLGEAIDERTETRRVAEDGAPLLVGEVGGDHDCAALVPVADDAEQQVGGGAVGTGGPGSRGSDAISPEASVSAAKTQPSPPP